MFVHVIERVYNLVIENWDKIWFFATDVGFRFTRHYRKQSTKQSEHCLYRTEEWPWWGEVWINTAIFEEYYAQVCILL